MKTTLFATPLSGKSASLMILLCSPALIFSAMLAIPPLLFPSPQQNAYFYFAQVINQDPMRWVLLGVAAALTILALTVPLTVRPPLSAMRR